MKKTRMTTRLWTAALLAAVLLSCLAASASAAPERLTVGVPTDRCPIFYRDAASGELVGIGVDLMRAAAEAAGYEAEFRAVEEPTLKDALDSDAYDLIMPFGSAIASASGQASVVSDNLMQTPFTLVAEGNRVLPPLNMLRVGMLRSLSGGAETVKTLYPGMDIVFYETMADSVKALRASKVDALLHNSYVWSYVLQKPAYSDLSVLPSAMFSMDFRAGTPDTPEGRERIERLNGGVAALSDTRRQAVILDYTSRRLYRYDASDYLHQYGAFLLLITLLFAALIVIFLQKQHALRRQQEEKMRWLIDHDPLTGAYSLNGFRKQAGQLLRENPDVPYLLAYVNIKNFKYINDSLGMAAGDELLRFWVRKTQETLTEREAMGRIAGDHFAVLRQAGGEEKLRYDDEQVVEVVRNYFVDRGRENRVQICCGLYVLTPEDYKKIDVDHMLDCARVAERRLRDKPNDGYLFYNPFEWEKGKRVAEVVNHLAAALRTGEVRVWYQPQVDFETGRISGAEALCRWKHPELGWIRPDEFIPALEEAGMIFELDSFVWEQVCRDLHRWNGQGVRRSASINLSRCDMRDGRNIPEHLHLLTQKYAIDPAQLRIEITETAYVEDSAILIDATKQLQQFGFRVEMDDFGSGYSSLHMLKEVPVDRIKLDLSFLSGSGDAEKGRVIVSCMIRMVRELGMELIAEGVETDRQAQFLRSEGSPMMQGFYFFQPMPVEEFERISETGMKPAAT